MDESMNKWMNEWINVIMFSDTIAFKKQNNSKKPQQQRKTKQKTTLQTNKTILASGPQTDSYRHYFAIEIQ